MEVPGVWVAEPHYNELVTIKENVERQDDRRYEFMDHLDWLNKYRQEIKDRGDDEYMYEVYDFIYKNIRVQSDKKHPEADPQKFNAKQSANYKRRTLPISFKNQSMTWLLMEEVWDKSKLLERSRDLFQDKKQKNQELKDRIIKLEYDAKNEKEKTEERFNKLEKEIKELKDMYKELAESKQDKKHLSNCILFKKENKELKEENERLKRQIQEEEDYSPYTK